MSYNGSGTFQINTSGQPVVTGTSISSTVFNALTADLATGLSTAITKDGQTTTTARIPFALGINSTLVTDATNTTSGSIITAGGVGIAKALYVGTTANVAGAVTLQNALSVTGVTTVQAGTAALPAITTTGDTNTGIFFPAADTIAFAEGGVESMRIDSSGNVGLGVTPSAWNTGWVASQIGSAGCIAAIRSTTGPSVVFQNNAFLTTGGAWNYITSSPTNPATQYEQYNGSHIWYNAASGTGAITWNQAMILDSNSLYAYVGVNPSSNGATNARIFNSSSGSGTVTLYVGNQTITTSSDVRLKENIVDTQRNALELLGQLRVVDHTWNDPSDQCENNRNSRGTWMGLIAQEAQPVIPWLVNKPTADVDENGNPQYWHMDYGYSVPLLVKAIQEQQALITTLTDRITALEARNG